MVSKSWIYSHLAMKCCNISSIVFFGSKSLQLFNCKEKE